MDAVLLADLPALDVITELPGHGGRRLVNGEQNADYEIAVDEGGGLVFLVVHVLAAVELCGKYQKCRDGVDVDDHPAFGSSQVLCTIVVVVIFILFWKQSADEEQ